MSPRAVCRLPEAARAGRPSCGRQVCESCMTGAALLINPSHVFEGEVANSAFGAAAQICAKDLAP